MCPPSTIYYGSGIAVAPDESLIYVPIREDDMVAVIDASKLISGGVQGDPTALVTTIATWQREFIGALVDSGAAVGGIALTGTRLPTNSRRVRAGSSPSATRAASPSSANLRKNGSSNRETLSKPRSKGLARCGTRLSNQNRR